MRRLIVLVLLIGVTLAAAWIGGETWIAREAARRIEADPRIDARSVTPLREMDRIGLHLADVQVDTAQGPVAMPALDLFAAPTAPTEFHADLPPEMTVPVLGQPRKLGTRGGRLTLRVSPGSGMAVGRMAAVSGLVTLDGAPLAEGADVDASLTAIGAGAPPAARASYAVSGRLDRLAPAAALNLPEALAKMGAVSAEGRGRVWLTGALNPAQGAGASDLVGLAIDSATLSAGRLSARLAGQVGADDAGRAQGAVFVYTADPRGWLALAASAGLVPEKMVPLAGTALETAATTPVDLPPGVPAPADPADGEFRIPLLFRDGTLHLGALPLGPVALFGAR